MRKFRYSNFSIVTANVVELMADYVIMASGNSNLLRPSVLCLGNRGATTSLGHFVCVVVSEPMRFCWADRRRYVTVASNHVVFNRP